MLNSRFCAGVLSFALLALGAGVALGQVYPVKPVRLITTSPGSGNDVLARAVVPGLAAGLGQTVIIENRGTGFLAAEAVYKTPPDGYTLTMQGSIFWTIPLLREVPYDVVRDFAPIALISRQANLLTVHPSLPVRSVKELIALAKARPGQMNYGSSGTGGAGQLAMEQFKALAGVNLIHVPYKGQSPAITALLSGEVQVLVTDVGLLMPHAKAGRLRALAVTSTEPSALAPGLPTVAGSGLPGFESVGLTGMWAPAKTPAPVINRLNQELVRYTNQSDIKAQLLGMGEEVVGSTPEQFATIIGANIAKLSKIIKDVGIKAD